MANVFVGLGSNKGNREKNILRAVEILKKNNQKILKISSICETKPYGYRKQRKFLNAVVQLKTVLSPGDFLLLCKKIEKEIGRKKGFRWGPREIDMDILFFAQKVLKSRKLTIPHKDLHNRKFVLLPLLEIAPNFVHPVLKKRISEI